MSNIQKLTWRYYTCWIMFINRHRMYNDRLCIMYNLARLYRPTSHHTFSGENYNIYIIYCHFVPSSLPWLYVHIHISFASTLYKTFVGRGCTLVFDQNDINIFYASFCLRLKLYHNEETSWLQRTPAPRRLGIQPGQTLGWLWRNQLVAFLPKTVTKKNNIVIKVIWIFWLLNNPDFYTVPDPQGTKTRAYSITRQKRQLEERRALVY